MCIESIFQFVQWLLCCEPIHSYREYLERKGEKNEQFLEWINILEADVFKKSGYKLSELHAEPYNKYYNSELNPLFVSKYICDEIDTKQKNVMYLEAIMNSI